MMHLTCTNATVEQIRSVLEEAKKAGIRNVLALRGDAPRDQEMWRECAGGFTYAVDLVRFIKKEFGDYFCVGVAGYPEGHPDGNSVETDLLYLVEKVKAGADLVITQLFYDVDKFLRFVDRARELGINVPILPGIMPIQSYAGFKKMVSFCKVFVPQTILDSLEPIQNDDKQVKAYGIKLAIEMCKKLLDHGTVGLHFYTLNLERSTLKILEGLGMVAKKVQQYPWESSRSSTRCNREQIRPIFWANRPSSYLARTQNWDEFPNGRWGDARSPAFGDLSDYHLCPLVLVKPEVRRAMWGESVESIDSVAAVFIKYISGEIPKLPWCEGPVQLETSSLKDFLARTIKNQFFTINSQPRVNGAVSTDESFGWGGPNGYVYQKAYLEFFTNAFNLEKLTHVAKSYPHVTFHAMNVNGQTIANCTPGTNAVTWGVFPGCEIKQPTVVCSTSFEIWKDEAFALWKSQWATSYDVESSSYKLLENIRTNWWLVNVVDNDFVHGDILKFITDVVDCDYATIDTACKIDAQIEKHALRIQEACSSVVATVDCDFYDD